MSECISHHLACECREAMFADLVEAAQDIVVCGADPVIVARLDACLARIDGRDPLDLFRPEGA